MWEKFVSVQTVPLLRVPQSRGMCAGIRTAVSSLRLDLRRANNLAPFLSFFGDNSAEILGRAREHSASHVGKACRDLWIGERGIYLRVELANDFDGRVPGRADPEPRRRFVAGHELGDGRQIGQYLQTSRACHGQCPQLAGADVLD